MNTCNSHINIEAIWNIKGQMIHLTHLIENVADRKTPIAGTTVSMSR